MLLVWHYQGMKSIESIKYRPYSKTSYLPACGLVAKEDTPQSELLYICGLQSKEIARLKLQSEHQMKIIDVLGAEVERLRVVNQGQRDELFGRSSEQNVVSELAEEPTEKATTDQTASSPVSKRRGGTPGHKGHGRKLAPVPEVEVLHEVPADQTLCAHCGKPYARTGLTEDSYEYDIEYKLVRVRHRRKRMVRTCHCSVSKFITAPKPSQVIPKGKFSHTFLAHVVVMKYFFQIPLHRLAHMLWMRGLLVTESTFAGNLRTLHDLLTPLYNRLVQINQSAEHWHVDETGWKVFARTEPKNNFNWWLWVFASTQTVVYLVDPSRSASVLLKHFGTDATGIVSSDRYCAYNKLVKSNAGLKNAFCWVHFRRDFIKAAKGNLHLNPWARQWLTRIRDLYRLNHRRLTVFDDAMEYAEAQAHVEQEVQNFRKHIEQELASRDLIPRQRTILKNALKNWAALTVFMEHPHIPMDNNRAERLLRLAALGRKNYYGCHAQWSAEFVAVCLSILQTAVAHGLNAEAYLRYILDELAQHQGNHPDIDLLLPWNVLESKQQEYNMKTGDPPCLNSNSQETSAVGL